MHQIACLWHTFIAISSSPPTSTWASAGAYTSAFVLTLTIGSTVGRSSTVTWATILFSRGILCNHSSNIPFNNMGDTLIVSAWASLPSPKTTLFIAHKWLSLIHCYSVSLRPVSKSCWSHTNTSSTGFQDNDFFFLWSTFYSENTSMLNI